MRAPVLQSLFLLNDLGNPGAAASNDGRVAGWALSEDVLPSMTIEFDHDGDGFADGFSDANSEGYFTYTAEGMPLGQVTLWARATEWNDDRGDMVYGDWASLTFTLLAPVLETLVVENLEARIDTSVSAEGIPKLAGTVWGIDLMPGLTVEIDTDNDGTSDLTAVTDAEGRFEASLTGLAHGTHTVQARAELWDSAVADYRYTEWESLEFSYEALNHQPIKAVDLAVRNLVATEVVGGEVLPTTFSPTIVGRLVNDGSASLQTVEVDHDGDGVVDGSTTSGTAGSFVYEAEGVGFGVVSLMVRATEWDSQQVATVVGPWKLIRFVYLDPSLNDPAEVAELNLLNAPQDPSDPVSDATLSGFLSNDQGVGNLRVEFDHDGDHLVDGFTATNAEGTFTYTPTGLPAGPVTVYARAREWDYNLGAFQYGAWISVSFTFEPPVNHAPVVSELALLSDSGSSFTDGLTGNPTITGLITDEGEPTSGLTVEFDVNGDSQVDATVLTNSEGRFLFTPQNLNYGPITVQARAKQWDVTQNSHLLGDWNSISFTYEDQPDAAPLLASFGLLQDTGLSNTDGITTDPRLAGNVTNENGLAGLVVEFDHNGDGLVDGAATVNAFGQYVYTPADLPYGSVDINARTRETEGTESLYGAWQSFQFTYDAAPHPNVSIGSLRLANDTGASAIDNVTTDPALTGTIVGTGNLNDVTLEFDHNQDGQVDGTTTTNSSGGGIFNYSPSNLQAGSKTLSVRVLGTVEWTNLSFTLQIPAATVSLSLNNDTGVDGSDGITSDPAINGNLTSNPQGATTDPGVTIEFDHNGDGFVDGSVVTGAGGAFSYSPAGLPYGQSTIRARTSQTNADGTIVRGDWTVLSFSHVEDPDATGASTYESIDSTYNNSISSAESTFEAASQTAQSTFQVNVDAASGSYVASVAAANSTMNTAVAAANSTYAQASAAATAAYQDGVAAAAAAFASAMNSYTGDSTTFTADAVMTTFTANPQAFSFGGWLWPDAPSSGGGPVLQTSGPGGPSAPSYDGSSFDVELDPVFMSDLASAQSAMNSALATAKAAYDSAISQAKGAYDTVVAAAKQAKSNADNAANATYQSELEAPNPQDLEAAQTVYHNEVEATNAAFETAESAALGPKQARFFSDRAKNP